MAVLKPDVLLPHPGILLAGTALLTQSAPVEVLYLFPPEQPGVDVVIVTSGVVEVAGVIVNVTGVVLWATVEELELLLEGVPPLPEAQVAPTNGVIATAELLAGTTIVLVPTEQDGIKLPSLLKTAPLEDVRVNERVPTVATVIVLSATTREDASEAAEIT